MFLGKGQFCEQFEVRRTVVFIKSPHSQLQFNEKRNSCKTEVRGHVEIHSLPDN